MTNENRQEYVDLYVKYLLEDSVQKQLDEFLKGFKLVCEIDAFAMFRAEELQLLICGSPELDFVALERAAKYDGYTSSDPIVKSFWEIVHAMTLEDKKKLLRFTTGSDRSPIGGLGKLPFIIVKNGPDSERIPSSHTCFNSLLIPCYASKEKLKQKLTTALNLSSEGFGMI